MVTIDVQVTGSSTSDGYAVRWAVSSSTDMPSEIFLVLASTMKFQKVCTSSDMVYPVVRDVGTAFYRVEDVTYTYTTLTEAEEAKVLVAESIQALVDEYTSGVALFTTTETITYT